MAWFLKPKYSLKKSEAINVQEGLWHKCPQCNAIVYNKDWDENMKVCANCGFHDRLNSFERVQMLVDPGTFVETHNDIVSADPLEFYDGAVSYGVKVKSAMEKTNLKEAVITGYGKLSGIEIAIAVMDFSFLGGSMGSVVGEKITLSIEDAHRKRLPLVIVTASGGARMHEGILSLMQMAKTSAALKRFSDDGGLYIALLTNPTTGGVTASYAMLGDFIIAEPDAHIGFAGPRIIEQTIRQKLPSGFQKSKFLLEHGYLDMIVERKNLKKTIYQLIQYTH